MSFLKALDDRRKNSGLSIFAFSQTLNADDVYKNGNYEKPHEFLHYDICDYPLAFFSIWFRYFFDCSDGGNFAECCKKLIKDDVDYSTIKDLWKKNLNTDLNNDTFKAQCWLVSRKTRTAQGKEKGMTSELWRGLRMCLQKSREERFVREVYEDDNTVELSSYKRVPAFLKNLVADYNIDREKGNGKDFSDFIEILKKDKKADTNAWYTQKVCQNAHGEACSLLEKCQEEFSREASADVYLYYQSQTGSAEYILGFDNIPGDLTKIEFTNWEKKKQSLQVKYTDYISYPLELGKEYTYMKKSFLCPQDFVSTAYVCHYNSNRNDYRKFWWEKKSSIPYSKSRILLLLPYGDNTLWDEKLKDLGIVAECEISSSVKLYENWYNVCILNIKSRPTHAVDFHLNENIVIKFNGRTPTVVFAEGSPDTIFPDEHFDAICCRNSKLKLICQNIEEDDSVTWFISGEEKSTEKIFETDFEKFTEPILELKISCKIVSKEEQYMRRLSVLVLSQEVVKAIEDGKGSSDVWSVAKEENVELRIADRLLQLNRKNIMFQNETYSVFTKDTDWFCWFSNCDKNCIGKQHISFSELSNWEFFIPDDQKASIKLSIPALQTVVTGKDFQSEYGCCKISISGLLEKLTSTSVGEYIHEPNASEKKYEIVNEFHEVLFTSETLPVESIICRNTENSIGVLIPAKKNKIFVSWFSDGNLENLFRPKTKEIDTEYSQYPHFVPLDDWLQQFKDDKGEQFLLLHINKKFSDNEVRNGSHISSARMLMKHKSGCTSLREIHSPENIRCIQDFWSRTGERFAGESRLMSYECCDPMPLDKWFENWCACIKDKKMWDSIPQKMSRMLEDGYNFLAEPEWIFQDKKTFEKSGGKNKRELKWLFVDNSDNINEKNRGRGLCSALIAQQMIDEYMPLNQSVVRELTRLCSGKRSFQMLVFFIRVTRGKFYYDYPIYSAYKNGKGKKACLTLETSSKVSGYKNVISNDPNYQYLSPLESIQFSLNKTADWQCISQRDSYKFDKFQINEEAFANLSFQNDMDATADDGFLEHRLSGRELSNILSKMKDSQFVSGCIKDIITASLNYFEKQEDSDYKKIVLTGLICSVNLTICRNRDIENWWFNRESEQYKAVCLIVADLFNERDTQEGKIAYRRLMRTMCSFMGLFSYFKYAN